MTAKLGTFDFDLWQGEPPPLNKKSVELQYRPCVTLPSVLIFPAQATQKEFVGTYYGTTDSSAGYRNAIGTILTLIYAGANWGTFFVLDVEVIELRKVARASGVRDGTPFNYTMPWKIVTRWKLVSRQ